MHAQCRAFGGQNETDHLVLADMGCRNTFSMAESQSSVYSVWDTENRTSRRVNIVSSYIKFLSEEKHANDV